MIKVTEELARAAIRAVYELTEYQNDPVKLEHCRKIANYLYNHFGISTTTLFVEKVLNEIKQEEQKNG